MPKIEKLAVQEVEEPDILSTVGSIMQPRQTACMVIAEKDREAHVDHPA